MMRLDLSAAFTLEKAVGKSRSVRCIASTPAVDRQGDTILASAWDLESYRKCPAVLFAHDSHDPVAAASDVRIEGGQLKAQLDFPAEGAAPRSDAVWRMITVGVLKGVSVGFVPKAGGPSPDGMGWTYTKAELIELSVVAVPANAQALIEVPLLQNRSAGPSAAMAIREAEMVGLRRLAVPERAAKVATAARAAGRTRLARAAGDLARLR
jgi:HK97 family phage prohead protease